VRVTSVIVGDSELEAVVRFEEGESLRTSREVAERTLALLPGLARHRCDNPDGRTFGAEARDTEVAHLLEHIACELMSLAGSPRTLRGSTSWDFARDGRGVFRVRLRFDNDLTALGALKEAAAVTNAVVAGREAPDMDAAVRRLCETRGAA
jgi:hypothetical protein